MFHKRKPKLPSVMRIGSRQFDIVETRELFSNQGGPTVAIVKYSIGLIMINSDASDVAKARNLLGAAMDILITDHTREYENLAQILLMLFAENPRFVEFVLSFGAELAHKAKRQ